MLFLVCCQNNTKETNLQNTGDTIWVSSFPDQSKYAEDRKCKEMNRTESMHPKNCCKTSEGKKTLLERAQHKQIVCTFPHVIDLIGEGKTLPSHLRPWRTNPHSISPQWSQKAGALYEWTKRAWGRIWKSSKVAEAVEIVTLENKSNGFSDL